LKGSTYRRCSCRDPKTGKELGSSCPRRKSCKHGYYSIRQELPPRENGTRRSFSRAGYESLNAAQSDLDHVRSLLALADKDDPDSLQRLAAMLAEVAAEKAPLPAIEETQRRLRAGLALRGSLTVGEWLDQWFAAKKRRKTTLNGYASHIRFHLKPRIGHVRLDRLNVGHLVEMFDAIADDNEVIAAENEARREQIARCKPSKPGRPVGAERKLLAAERAKLAEMKPFRKITGPASRQAIRRTLRAALNSAIAQQLITFNPASHVELESGKRPKPLLWTNERVRRWRETGEIPGPVMVWTPQQFGVFPDAAEGDRLYAVFHLMGSRGLRRGEAVGQDWHEIDLDAGLITPAKEIVVDGWDPTSPSRRRTAARTRSRSTARTSPCCATTKPARRRSARSGAKPGRTPARASRRKTAHGSTPGRSPRPSAASSPRPTCRPSPCGTYATSPRRSRTEAAATSTR
jgi:integrase